MSAANNVLPMSGIDSVLFFIFIIINIKDTDLVPLVHVTEAVRKNPGTRMATDQEVEAPIKEWLRFAPERDRGRKEREQRKREQSGKQQTPSEPQD